MSATSVPGSRRVRAAILIAASMALSATAAFAADRQDLTNCEDNSDVPRMIAACTNLAQDTRLPADLRSMALLKRGFGNFALGKMDAAEADLSEAVTLNPKNYYAHHELGLTLFKKGEPDRAIASLTEAIKLDPTGAASHVSRGQVYMSEDRLDEAIRDFTDAIKLGADKNTAFTKDQQVDRPEADRVAADYYAARAGAYYLKGNFNDAATDYHNAAGLFDPDGYNVIWETVSRSRAGSADASAALSTALDKGQLKDWPKSLGELLAGRITPAAALAAAKDVDQTCEAHYYGAIVQLRQKNVSAAQTELASARDGCPKTFREYHAAIIDLKRI